MVLPSPSFISNQVVLMTEINEAKCNQVPQFRDALLKSKKSSVFVATTYDDFWASGLDKDASIILPAVPGLATTTLEIFSQM